MNNNSPEIPDRAFMKALLKHTGIALAILVPLAMYTTFSHAETLSYSEELSHAQVIASTTSMQGSSGDATITQPTSVDRLDLYKYAGHWYEIARLPMRYQKDCASDVTATYHLNSDENGDIKSVDVINQCQKADGSMMRAEGLAKPSNNSGSELKVTFLPTWLRWLPIGKADYWVLGFDEGYGSALVGTPDNKYLWVLSRQPSLSTSTYNQYINIAKNQGYDVSKIKVTHHTVSQ